MVGRYATSFEKTRTRQPESGVVSTHTFSTVVLVHDCDSVGIHLLYFENKVGVPNERKGPELCRTFRKATVISTVQSKQ